MALDHHIPILIGLLAEPGRPMPAALAVSLRDRFPHTPLFVVTHAAHEAVARDFAAACGAQLLMAREDQKPPGISLDEFVAYGAQVLVLLKTTDALDKAKQHYLEAAEWGWNEESLNRPEPGPVIEVTGTGFANPEIPSSLQRIVEYNRDLAAWNSAASTAARSQSRDWLLGSHANHTDLSDPGLSAIVSRFEAADAMAGRYGERLRRSINAIFAVFGAAAFFFALVNLDTKADYAYLVCILLIAILVWVARRSRVEPRALDYRALAEGLRVQFFWRVAGVPEWVSDNYLSKHQGAVAWIRAAIQAVEALDTLTRTNASPADGLAIARERWVADQAAYYEKRLCRQAPVLRRIEASVLVAEWSILAAAALFALALFRWPDPHADRFQFVFGVLAAVAIVARGYGLKRGFDHMATQYSLMSATFSKAKEKLAVSNDEAARALLGRLGKEALIEHGEWLTTHRSRPLEILK